MRCRLLTPAQVQRFGIAPRARVKLDSRETFADMGDTAVRTIASLRADGSVLACAAPERLLRDLDAVVASQGLRLVGIVPAPQAFAMGRALTATIVDGSATWSVTAQRGRITGLTFARGVATSDRHSPLDLTLVQAAVASGEIVFIRPRDNRLRMRPLALSVALAGIATLLLAPPVASASRAAGLRRALAESEEATRDAERRERERVLEDEREARVRSFERSARLQSRLPLLARIATALPRDIFVAQMVAESTTVEMIVMGEDVTRLPRELQLHDDISNARVVGAVTRDVVNERALQRATVRFEIGAARQLVAVPESNQ
jgi:hypothetical protein